MVQNTGQPGRTKGQPRSRRVLLGLGLTLLLLIVAGKALPALPISIFLGVFFYFLGRYTLEPYVDNMTFHGIVV